MQTTNKKKIISILIFIVIFVILLKKCSKDDLEGCWITDIGDKRICFEFNDSEFMYYLDDGSYLSGTYEVEKNIITFISDNGESFIEYKIKGKKLTLTSSSIEYELERSKQENKKKYLTKYQWHVENSSQSLKFNKDGTVEAVNSKNEKNNGRYEIFGINNEFLKLNVDGDIGIYVISCDKEKLILYPNNMKRIEYISD